MKSTSQIYEQSDRLSKLLHIVTTNAIKRVHPETGGNIHLAHNWGNDEAQKILEQYRDRQSLIFNLGRKHYHLAFKRQYPEHLASKIQTY